MKHLQYSQKRKPTSMDISVDAPRAKNKSHNSITLKYKQTVLVSEASSRSQNVADRIRNYCLTILMFVLTGHAVVCKFKSPFEKNVWATKEGFNILRVIFLAGRNIVPAQQQNIQSVMSAIVNQLSYGDLPERLLTQLNTIAPGLYAQIHTVIVTSETVVSTLW